MRGLWLTRNEIMQSLGIKQSFFDSQLAKELPYKLKGSRKKYFVGEDRLSQNAKSAYADRFVDYDDEAAEVEDVLGDVSSGVSGGPSLDDLNAARLDNIKARTALISQKIVDQKREVWEEWNKEYFEIFADAFSKFKNELVSLRLSKDQLEVLKEKLETALSLLKDGLDGMWARYIEDKKEEEENP